MFEIQYSPSKSLKEEASSKADDATLQYSLFPGDVVLISETSKINLEWGWIPLLDFAYCLVLICNNLVNKARSKEIFEFTESEGILHFNRNIDNIEITTSFSNENLNVNINSFKGGVYSFYSELVNQIKQNNGQILNNPNFRKYEKILEDVVDE